MFAIFFITSNQFVTCALRENLPNQFSGVQIPCDVCTRFECYLYSTKCSWIKFLTAIFLQCTTEEPGVTLCQSEGSEELTFSPPMLVVCFKKGLQKGDHRHPLAPAHTRECLSSGGCCLERSIRGNSAKLGKCGCKTEEILNGKPLLAWS